MTGKPRQMIAQEVFGSCTSPVIVRYDAFVDREYHVRCRRCPGCLRARQYLWQLRAEAEWLIAPRTVLFTGTFRNQTWDIEVCKDATTKWLKRCRHHLKKRDHSVRYLVIPERHKSGAWHIHSLLHSEEDVPMTLYRECWNEGFTTASVGDIRSAGYVTKYVSKDLTDGNEHIVPRIRASRNPTYGAWVMERDADKVKEMMQDKPKKQQEEIWLSNLKQMIREQEKKKSRNLMDLLIPDPVMSKTSN